MNEKITTGLKQIRSLKIVDIALFLVVAAMVVYQLMCTQEILLSTWQHQNLHYFFALLVVFLGVLRAKPNLWPLILVLIAISIVTCGYVHLFADDLVFRVGRPTTPDLIIGVLVVLIGFEACRRSFGWILPIIASLFIAYAFLGEYFPGSLQTTDISYKRIISHLSIGFNGIYGLALGTSANMLFYFMLFGGLLEATGATRFFMQLGNLVARRLRSGAAQTAVVGSSMVGMITGSAMANVGITGSFTIPTMKKAGYTPEQAGAIEAAASTGGQIMPPIMGATAFIMAAWLGIPYINVCGKAIIPAIFYFIAIAIYAHVQATRLNIYSSPQPIDKKAMLTGAPLFIAPLILLIMMMVQGHSPRYAAFWAIISVIALALIFTRPSLKTWINGFIKGTMAGAAIGVACAVVGPIISISGLTGLGINLPSMVEGLCGGILPIALILTAIISIILGMGLHTLAVYILVVLVLAPILTGMGVGLEQAHFFVFYFAVFSMLTPPVALASLTAAGVAGGSYFKTAIEGVKAGIVAFLVPFLIIYNPILLGNFEDPLWGVLSLIALLLAIIALVTTLVGYYLAPLSRSERGILFMSAVGLLAYGLIENYVALIGGIALFFLVTLGQFRKGRIIKPMMEGSYE